MGEVISHTFKGDGSFPSPEAGVNWQIGFDHGYQYALENLKIGKDFDPFPGDSRKGWFGNGFAEGVKSGRISVLNRDYPGWNRLDYETESGIGITATIVGFKNGNYIRIIYE